MHGGWKVLFYMVSVMGSLNATSLSFLWGFSIAMISKNVTTLETATCKTRSCKYPLGRVRTRSHAFLT